MLWDPAFFAGIAFLVGLLIGAVCAARFFSASPAKAALVGLGLTLAIIGISGGATTLARYRALPRDPKLKGGNQLEFELRLPEDCAPGGALPERGVFDSEGPITNSFRLSQQIART